MSVGIVLAEWNWHGHHPTYFRHYLHSLLRASCHVLALCPAPGSLASEPAFAKAVRQGQLQFGKLQACRRKLRPARLRETVRAFELMRSLKALISNFEKSTGHKTSLVFFACIYENEFKAFPFFSWMLRRPLSGLLLHSNIFRNPSTNDGAKLLKILRNDSFIALAVLDEGTSEDYARAIRKKVVVFPEISDLTPPSNQTALARRMLHMAVGRPIVGVLGYLHPYKGAFTLARVALNSHPDVLFAFVGEIPWSAYSLEERQALENAVNRCENVFFHSIRVEDGIEFNSAVAACDVIFASYHNFPNSSNILTKAALARKQVIVSAGYLMAERVRQYHLGAVVPQKDPEAVVKAISLLLHTPAEKSPLWDEYLAANSTTALDAAFAQILQAAGIKSQRFSNV